MSYMDAGEQCDGCHRRCFLSNPGCHVGRGRAYDRMMQAGYGEYDPGFGWGGQPWGYPQDPWAGRGAFGHGMPEYDGHGWGDRRDEPVRRGAPRDEWKPPHDGWDAPRWDDGPRGEWEHPRAPHDEPRDFHPPRPPREHHGGRPSPLDDPDGISLIRRFQHCAHLLMHRQGREGGRARAIMVLDRCDRGCMSQRELARRLDIRSASVSELLAKMEESGLIKRMPDPHDRRVVLVRLTEKGRNEAKHVADQRKKANEDLFAVLDDEEKDQLESILDKLTGFWQGDSGHEDPKA